MKPKQLIKDVTFDFDKDETKCGPHIAYTLPSQGGAASGLNVGYLFKSDDVSEQTVKEAEKIQKAMSMRNSKMILENALKEAYCGKDEFLCVEDWKDGQVYFSTGDYDGWEMMVTSFTMTEDGQVTVGDTASPVVQITDYMIVEGKVKLSEEAEDKLETGLYEIVSKSINKADTQLKLFKSVTEYKESLEKASTPVAVSDDSTINVNNTKDKTEKPLDIQELMKSAEFQDILKAQLEAAQAPLKEELEKAKAKAAEAEEILKAAEQVQKNEFTEFVKSTGIVVEDKTDAVVDFLMKSRKTAEFDMIQDILKSAKEQIEAMKEEVNKTKEQFAITEVGKDGKVVVDAQDPQEVIKAKAAKWAAENKSK
ncbi:hypothetical protein phiA019_0103 [Aeromonas phage phiA019]|nr:hypothetical protein phiA009_0106 [Aeromonas phage phiA009]ULG01640.1 hypothetical protein phiA019_0103 [Aeromonas phage phiA019]